MSVRKLTAGLLTALALLGGVSTTAQAQEHLPVADPFEFDPDFRWFEPMHQMDFDDMKPSKRANSGWFGSYDRTRLWASRPELDDPNVSETKLDPGWGHRYEVGFMRPDVDKGWLFNWSRIGIGKYFTIERERVNRINTDQLGGTPANQAPPFGFIVPEGDGNTPGLNTRTYFIQDSENVVNYDAYELNKTWRMEPYRYGGILEPLVGVRWMRVTDVNTLQTYNSSLDIDTVPFIIFGDAEQLITDNTTTENEVIAGQVGFRYIKFRDRFTFSGDFRAFTGASLQCSTSREETEITIYDGAGEGAAVD
ncbi:MAG: hypothetical protein HKN47_25535, partial [Pirellulaceae bacterium]|nr:hypothetical protein [Pirellulaceae bacterium]